MAKIQPMIHMDSMSGKYNRTDRVYTKVRKFDNQVIGVALKNPVRNQPPTEAQATVQQKMANVAAQAKAIFSDPTQLATYKASWKSKNVSLHSADTSTQNSSNRLIRRNNYGRKYFLFSACGECFRQDFW